MTRMRMLLLCVVFVAVWSQAQQPVATPALLSPQAAYEDSSKPLDIVRKSVANWSPSELTALGVSMKKAGDACEERINLTYAGDDLIAMSRLCSFGQQWSETKTSAAKYIQSSDAEKPQLALAYAFQLEAALHMHDVSEIMADAKAMLASVPYDNNVNATSDDTIAYLQLAYTPQALALETVRQPLLLAALAAEKPLISRHSLYASGIAQAELMQYMNQTEQAAASIAALDQALGDEAKLSPDDLVPIGQTRKLYGLLGKPLPKVTLTMSLANATEKPQIDTHFGALTALLLFPDWCAQCIAVAKTKYLWKAEQLDQGIARLFVLLAAPPPDLEALRAEQLPAIAKPVAAVANPGAPAPKTASEQLLNTQTFVVPPETIADFAANDLPFVIVVDHDGVVRFASSGPENLLQPGDFLDRIVEHVAETWPPPKP